MSKKDDLDPKNSRCPRCGSIDAYYLAGVDYWTDIDIVHYLQCLKCNLLYWYSSFLGKISTNWREGKYMKYLILLLLLSGCARPTSTGEDCRSACGVNGVSKITHKECTCRPTESTEVLLCKAACQGPYFDKAP